MASLKRILLVEDNEQDIELTLSALEAYKLASEVAIARNGAEALDYLYRRGPFAERAEGLPAVVMLDLKMPTIDGLEVLRQIKVDPDLKTIPVVMVTSSHEEQDLLRSYDLGVNAYVTKPVDFRQFMDSIKEVGFFWAMVNEPPPESTSRTL